MALILGSSDGDVVNSRAIQELVAELDSMIAGQAAYLMPDQHTSLIHGISRELMAEREWEEQSSIQMQQALHDIRTAPDVDSFMANYRSFQEHASAYFNRRGSVLSLHDFCSRCRDISVEWALRSALGSGENPVPFTVCALGNYGRMEPTLSSPCDLMMLYGDTSVSGEAWFSKFADKVSRVLDCVKLYAPIMKIDDPEWRGGMSLWRSRIASQAGTPDPSSETVALCDLRHVFGDDDLAMELRSLAHTTLVNDQSAFLSALRTASIMPVGFNFFGRLRMEKSGSHRGEFNLVQFALMPLVVTIRMLAIQKNLVEASTFNRIKRLQTSGDLGVDLAAKLLKAYHDFHRIKLAAEVAGKGSEREGFYLDREEISHDDESCLKQGLDALFNLQRIVYQNVEA